MKNYRELHFTMWDWIAENLPDKGNSLSWIEKRFFEENFKSFIPRDHSYACQEAYEKYLDSKKTCCFKRSPCDYCPLEKKVGRCKSSGSSYSKLEWNLHKGTLEKAKEHARAIRDAWRDLQYAAKNNNG